METALNINWLLKHKFHKYFDKYIDLDYGIGIEYSDAYIIRAGLTNSQNNNDLVYISPAVNLAVAISNQLAGDNNIGITEDVFSNLDDDLLYDEEDDDAEIWDDTEYITWADEDY